MNRLKNKFTDQQGQYFIFALYELIPSLLLVAYSYQSITTRLAMIFVPLSIYLFVYTFSARPGVVRWWLFPKMVLDVFQLVLIYLFGGSIIAVDMFLNLVTSNSSEAGELLGNIWPAIVGSLILYVPIFHLAYRSIKTEEKLTDSFRRKQRLVAIMLFGLGTLLGIGSKLSGNSFAFYKDVYPINVLYNQVFAVRKWFRVADHMENSADFSFQATCTATDNRRNVVIAVVGETSRAVSWGLYNPELSTNPHLSARDGMVVFRDVLTQSNTTHKSVPMILSTACAENFNVIYKQKSIVTAFKEAGYYTVTLSNQQPNHSFLENFYAESDRFIDFSFDKNGVPGKTRPDGCLLEEAKKWITSSDRDLFLLIHLYGSHFNYSERYPAEFSVHKPDRVEAIAKKFRREMENAYYNTILYTDYLLNELIDYANADSLCNSALFFLSDHGEDLFDDARNRYLHASPTPTFYQLYIPCFIWFSENYRRAFPDKYTMASTHCNVPCTTNIFFHTLTDLGHLSTPYADSSLMITSSSFERKVRFYLNDHDCPVRITESGILPEDIRMMEQWKLSIDR